MARLTTFCATDVDDQAQALNGWEQSYEQLDCGGFRGAVWQLETADGVLLRESTNRKLREAMSPPPRHVVLAIALSVVEGTVFAGRQLDRDSLMVLSGQQHYDLVTAGAMDLIGLSVHQDQLDKSLAPDMRAWLARAQTQGLLGLPAPTAAAIRHMLLAVCRESADQLEQLQAGGAESALLSSTLSHAVVLAMHGTQAQAASSIPRRADTRQRVVKRAIEFMAANLHKPIGVPDICAAACASRRSLQYCFEELLQTSPQGYLRAMRLNQARRALRQDADTAIADIAHDLGFGSASHFTRHYRLMFDELPSDTRQRRGGAARTSVPV